MRGVVIVGCRLFVDDMQVSVRRCDSNSNYQAARHTRNVAALPQVRR
jgi:hypothetical protein